MAQYQILGYGYKLPPYLNPNRNVVFGFLLVAHVSMCITSPVQVLSCMPTSQRKISKLRNLAVSYSHSE